MKINLIQISVVVLAEDHNPTILNPDFLYRQKIIPDDWDWKSGENPPITTPAVSTVQFSNQVSISVQRNKLQITDASVGNNDVASSKIAEIASKYINTLPHVRYKAVGINFQSLAEVQKPEEFITDRFISAGSWNTESHPLIDAGLRFIYPLEGGVISYNLDSGKAGRTIEGKTESMIGLLLNANFHRECDEEKAHDDAVRHLKSLIDDWKKHQSMIVDLLGANY